MSFLACAGSGDFLCVQSPTPANAARDYGKRLLPPMDDLYVIPLVMTVVAALSIGAIYLISLLFKDGDEE